MNRISWKTRAQELERDYTEIAQQNATLRQKTRPIITVEHQAEIQQSIWGEQDRRESDVLRAEVRRLKAANAKLRAAMRVLKRSLREP